MERFIIQFDPDAVGEPNTYWDGSTPATDINSALLFPTLVAGRQNAGTLQTQFTDREVVVKRVTVTIALAPAAPGP